MTSPMQLVLDELTTYARRPFSDEMDNRPLPDEEMLQNGLGELFNILSGMFSETRLEPDIDDILWNLVNLFHRKAERIGRLLDRNSEEQKRSSIEQDGSEVKSVELERLTAEGLTFTEQRNVFEAMRDMAADYYDHHTGSHWRPHSGSMANRKVQTAAMIDSRDFLRAKQQTEAATFIPEGTLIAFSGGSDYQDYDMIWQALDRVHGKYADMVLIHGGSTRGAELIASKWCKSRNIQEVLFKPDWDKHNRAAPFKRNDLMLEQTPKGVIIFPGNGVTQNLADKAKKMGIRVMTPVTC